MVTWVNRLHGMNNLTTMREVRKQLNYLTSKEVELVHFNFFIIFILALIVLIYPMLYAQFEWQSYKKYENKFLKHVSPQTLPLCHIGYWSVTLPLGS